MDGEGLARSLDRPVSPWGVLALGAVIPLYDPHTVTDVGWQLSGRWGVPLAATIPIVLEATSTAAMTCTR